MATLIIGTIVFGLFILVGYKVYQDHKKGKGCAGGCKGCSSAGNCHKK
ncbi:MAG: FeoB-associated Cys-rich membrane protein [Cellulosilyticaceae bacterium]